MCVWSDDAIESSGLWYLKNEFVEKSQFSPVNPKHDRIFLAYRLFFCLLFWHPQPFPWIALDKKRLSAHPVSQQRYTAHIHTYTQCLNSVGLKFSGTGQCSPVLIQDVNKIEAKWTWPPTGSLPGSRKCKRKEGGGRRRYERKTVSRLSALNIGSINIQDANFPSFTFSFWLKYLYVYIFL